MSLTCPPLRSHTNTHRYIDQYREDINTTRGVDPASFLDDSLPVITLPPGDALVGTVQKLLNVTQVAGIQVVSTSVDLDNSQITDAQLKAITDLLVQQMNSASSGQPASSDSGSSSSKKKGAIAGGVVGGCAGVALLAGLAMFIIHKRRTKQEEVQAFEATADKPAAAKYERNPSTDGSGSSGGRIPAAVAVADAGDVESPGELTPVATRFFTPRPSQSGGIGSGRMSQSGGIGAGRMSQSGSGRVSPATSLRASPRVSLAGHNQVAPIPVVGADQTPTYEVSCLQMQCRYDGVSHVGVRAVQAMLLATSKHLIGSLSSGRAADVHERTHPPAPISSEHSIMHSARLWQQTACHACNIR